MLTGIGVGNFRSISLLPYMLRTRSGVYFSFGMVMLSSTEAY